MTKPFIVMGDKTSHGGTVASGAPTATTHGKPIARLGDKVTCPKCGPTTIATGDSSMLVMGKPVARHGDKTACGATLIAGQSVTVVGAGSSGGSRPAANSMAMTANSLPETSNAPHTTSDKPPTAKASREKNSNVEEESSDETDGSEDHGEPSGRQWVSRFPTSVSTSDLTDPFRESVNLFIKALRNAGAAVHINATKRPPERAYLMHWSWKIVHGTTPDSIPEGPVDIDWAHYDSAGNPDLHAAREAAQDMVNGYGLQRLRVAPALRSRHIEGKAIDMNISWSGSLSIKNAAGESITIQSTPRDGMNPELAKIGAGYGVKKFIGGAADRPHWSSDGH